MTIPKSTTLAFVLALAMYLPGAAQARDVVKLPVPYMNQPDGSTCLPTSLCMALHFLGRTDLTTETVKELHKTCQYDRYNVPDLVKQYGVYAFPSWLEHAWTRETVEAELRAGRPVILGLDCSRAGHFVLAVGYTDDGRVIIHDPYWKEPGWYFGGPYVTTDWDKLIWRNGLMVRGEPFPEAPRGISGSLVQTTAPRTLLSGQLATAEFAIKNNGREPWPDGVVLAAVDAYSSPPAERRSPFAILPGDTSGTSGTWVSPTRAAYPDRKNLAPGEIAYFRVPLRAPGLAVDNKTVVYRENFNLVGPDGVLFSEHWQTGPSNRQIFFRVAVAAPVPADYKLPLVETAASGKPELPWKLKLGSGDNLTSAPDAPAFPGADKFAVSAAEDSASSPTYHCAPPGDLKPLRLLPPSGQEFEAAYIGDPLGRDYRVEAWVYCDYRPQDEKIGYDRVGIFLRDSGQHRFAPKTELESGEAIMMSYDTDNGRLRAGDHAIGGAGDSMRRSDTVYIKESGWHRFAIRAQGRTISYELDGREIAKRQVGRNRRDPEIDGAFSAGDCGVFVSSTYQQESERQRGLYFAGFRVEE